jgi:AraC-like DNA-binding protein
MFSDSEMTKTTCNKAEPARDNFDVLGDVLETLRFRGTIFFRSRLSAPWGMKLEPTDTPRFHIAMNGSCVIGTGDDKAPVHLKNMDIVILPHGDMHWIADQPGRKLVPSERAGEACELGNPMFQEGEITNKLICGLVQYEKAMRHPILDALPDIMHFADIEAHDPVWMTVQLIDSAMEQAPLSRASIIDRLTEVLFLQLLYRHIARNSHLTGFLSALGDRRVARILELIHHRPETPWTLESLGEKVGMSRATVARQFSKAVGMPPLTYLSNWRMIKAHYLIKHSTRSIDDIADQVGFSGARSLSKAFQRKYRYTPSQLRKRQLSEEA